MGPQPLEPPSSQTNSDQSGSIFHFAIHLSDRAKLHHTFANLRAPGLTCMVKGRLTLLKGKHLKTATRFRMIAFDSVNRHGGGSVGTPNNRRRCCCCRSGVVVTYGGDSDKLCTRLQPKKPTNEGRLAPLLRLWIW